MKLLRLDQAYDIKRLRPYPGNYRQHDLEFLAESLVRGQHRTVVVREETGEVLAGNGVYHVGVEKGWPALAVSLIECDDDEAQEIVVSDNRSQARGKEDVGLLAALLEQIDSRGRLEAVGYDKDYLNGLLDEINRPMAGEGDPDDAPGVPRTPTTAIGDTWLCGPHRIMCADATSTEAMDVLMAGGSASLMWTDPPYGVDYVGKTSEALTLQGDTGSGIAALLADVLRESERVLEPGSPFYLAHPPGALSVVFANTVLALGWRIHQTLVWVKDSMVLGHADYHYRHEPILYGWTPGEGRSGRGAHSGTRWYGDNSQTSVFEVERPKRSQEHPTMKPVGLVAIALRNSTSRGGGGPRSVRWLGLHPTSGPSRESGSSTNGSRSQIRGRSGKALSRTDGGSPGVGVLGRASRFRFLRDRGGGERRRRRWGVPREHCGLKSRGEPLGT